jgi:hypothetical protein
MDKIKVWFFAGGEAGTEKLNAFTGSYIRLMKEILQDDFGIIKGIYFRMPMFNVIWALNHSQKPLNRPLAKKFIRNALNQINGDGTSGNIKLTLTSSSSGSVIAAQTACCLAEQNRRRDLPGIPFDIALGASMIATNSELYRKLEYYREKGLIGSIIFDDLQDEGDNTLGIGGQSRMEAYRNAFGLMFPVFSKKFNGPSFLNTHPEKGHVHRKRSKTVQKAIDFLYVILVKHQLAGSYYGEKAATKVKDIETTEVVREIVSF